MKRDIFSELVEGLESLAKERQQHISVARELAPAGLRSSPNPGEAGVSEKQQLPEVLASASPERGPDGGSKLPRHR
jgi:hypothetical protein